MLPLEKFIARLFGILVLAVGVIMLLGRHVDRWLGIVLVAQAMLSVANGELLDRYRKSSASPPKGSEGSSVNGDPMSGNGEPVLGDEESR